MSLLLESISRHTTELKIDPHWARMLIEDYAYPFQRPLDAALVEYYAHAIATGKFLPTPIAIAYCAGTGYVIDGQHRLHALLKMGVSIVFPCVEYQCESMEQVAALYALHDRGKPRSERDSMRPFEAAEIDGMSVKLQSALSVAALVLECEFEMPPVFDPKRCDYEQRAKMMAAWQPEALVYASLLVNGSDRLAQGRFFSRAVMPVALATLRYSEARARDFWARAYQNDGLRRNEGAWHLYNSVIPLKANAPSAMAIKLRRVASCWNAHARGHTLTRLPGIAESRPIDIAFTPWDLKEKWQAKEEKAWDKTLISSGRRTRLTSSTVA